MNSVRLKSRNTFSLLICLCINFFSFAQGKITIKDSDALAPGSGFTLILLSNGTDVQLLGIGSPIAIDSLFLNKEFLFFKLNYQKKVYLIHLESFMIDSDTDYTLKLIEMKHTRFARSYNLIIVNEHTGVSRPFMVMRKRRG